MGKVSCYAQLATALLVIAAAAAGASASVAISGGEHRLRRAVGSCRGSVAECIAEEEYDMVSESSRRVLATTQYISYGALQRNTVPCSKRGASYYNCQEGAEANPYSRDCSSITRCRS